MFAKLRRSTVVELVTITLALALLIAGWGLFAQAHGPTRQTASNPAPTATLFPTATLVPTATPRPTATATPRPKPTATPKPVTNFLVVSIDRSSCTGSKLYPTLYFTNTYPNRIDLMFWSATVSSPDYFLHGGDGALLAGGQTGPVEILPAFGPRIALTITVYANGASPYPVPGYWHGIVQPC